MIKRIDAVQIRMRQKQRLEFLRKSCGLHLVDPVIAPRERLVMVQIHIVPHHVVISSLKNPVAQIDIVECDGKLLLVKTSDLAEEFRAHHQAGACHGEHIPHALVEAEIMLFRIVLVLQLVHRPHPKIYDARMLDDIGSRIEKLHTDSADIRQLRFLGKIGKPAGLANLDVVIEKQEQLSACLLCTHVAHLREVEIHGLIDVLRTASVFAAVVRLENILVLRAVCLTAAIVDDNDLIGRGDRVLLDSRNAGLQDLRIILAQDNDGNQPRRRRLRTEAPRQRIVYKPAVPENRPCRAVKQDLADMPDGELSFLHHAG